MTTEKIDLDHLKIRTGERSKDNWIAWIEHTSTWECGKNEVEALGKLMITIMTSGNFHVSVRCGVDE